MIDLSWVIDPIYIATIFFFIVGLQRMSHPLTARSGIVWAGAAMLIATLVTFLTPNLTNFALMAIAIVIGGGFGYIAAKRVAMTDMPQMIALYNGMGGGAAAGISAVALLGTTNTATTSSLAVDRRPYRGRLVCGEHHRVPETPGLDAAPADHLPGPEDRQHGGPRPRHRLRCARCPAAVMGPARCRHVPPAVLRPLARVRAPHDAPDRRGRHAGRHLDVQRLYRPCRRTRRVLVCDPQLCDGRCGYHCRRRGFAADAQHGAGDEPLDLERLLRCVRRNGGERV